MGMTSAFVALTAEELDRINDGSEDVRALFHRKLSSRDRSVALDIDKSWAVIHYLLTGSQWGGTPPNSLPIMGGAEVGGDLGYGPARILQPAEVAQAAAVLDANSTELLRRKFNPIELTEADIYPGVWEDGEEDFQYIEHWYQQLQQFYARAATNGQGLLLAIV